MAVTDLNKRYEELDGLLNLAMQWPEPALKGIIEAFVSNQTYYDPDHDTVYGSQINDTVIFCSNKNHLEDACS